MKLIVFISFLSILCCTICSASTLVSYDATETLVNVKETSIGYRYFCRDFPSNECPIESSFSFDFSKLPCVVRKTCTIRVSLVNDNNKYRAGSITYASDNSSEPFSNTFVFVDYVTKGAKVTFTNTAKFYRLKIAISVYPLTLSVNDMSSSGAYVHMALYGNSHYWENISKTSFTSQELNEFVVDSSGNHSVNPSTGDIKFEFFNSSNGVGRNTYLRVSINKSCRFVYTKLLQTYAPKLYAEKPEGLNLAFKGDTFMQYLDKDWNTLQNLFIDLGNTNVSATSPITFNSSNFSRNEWNILGHSEFFTGTELTIDFSAEACVKKRTCYARVDPGISMDIHYGYSAGTSNRVSSTYPVDFDLGQKLYAEFQDPTHEFIVNLYDDEAVIIQEIKHVEQKCTLKIIHHGHYDTFSPTSTSNSEAQSIAISKYVASGSVDGYIQEDFIELVYTDEAVVDLEGILKEFAPKFTPSSISIADIDNDYHLYYYQRIFSVKKSRANKRFSVFVLNYQGGTVRELVTEDANPWWKQMYLDYQLYVFIGAGVIVLLIVLCVVKCCCGKKQGSSAYPPQQYGSPPQQHFGPPMSSMNGPPMGMTRGRGGPGYRGRSAPSMGPPSRGYPPRGYRGGY